MKSHTWKELSVKKSFSLCHLSEEKSELSLHALPGSPAQVSGGLGKMSSRLRLAESLTPGGDEGDDGWWGEQHPLTSEQPLPFSSVSPLIPQHPPVVRPGEPEGWGQEPPGDPKAR